jgi:hypothetical protein
MADELTDAEVFGPQPGELSDHEVFVDPSWSTPTQNLVARELTAWFHRLEKSGGSVGKATLMKNLPKA